MADPANSVAVAMGSLTVTGTLTSFIAAEDDLFIAGGVVALIASRDSGTRITLKQPWTGPTIAGGVLWNVLSLGPYWRSAITTNLRITDLLTKWESGPIKWDASGSLSDRDQYNNQPKNFCFLATDPLPWRLYVKLANTNSSTDWSEGQILGDRGPVAFEEALAVETSARADGLAAAGARIDALDTSIPGRVKTYLAGIGVTSDATGPLLNLWGSLFTATKAMLPGIAFRVRTDSRSGRQDTRGFGVDDFDPVRGLGTAPGTFARPRADGRLVEGDSRGFAVDRRNHRFGLSNGDQLYGRIVPQPSIAFGDRCGFAVTTLHERFGASTGDQQYGRIVQQPHVAFGDRRGFAGTTLHERHGFGGGGALTKPWNGGEAVILADRSGFVIAQFGVDGCVLPRSRDADRSAIVLSRDGLRRVAWVDDARKAWAVAREVPAPDNVAAAYITGATGSRRVTLAIGTTEYPVSAPPSGQEDVSVERVTPTLLRYVRRQASGGALLGVIEDDLAPYSAHAATVTSLIHIPSIGQSLDAAIAYNAINTTPLRPNRGLMFNGGARPLGFGDYAVTGPAATALTPAVNMVGFAPLVERMEGIYGETRSSRMVDAFLAPLPSSVAALASVHGLGGASLAQISKGTAPYTNTVEAIRRAHLMAVLLGLTYEVPGIIHQQGPSDYGSASGVYRASLANQQATFQADVAALWGRTGNLPLFASQPSNWLSSGQSFTELPNEILQAALSNAGKIYAVYAEYLFAYLPDNGHVPPLYQQISGEYYARAVTKVRAGLGQSALAVYATAATLSGSNIVVTFNVPVGSLVLDTSYVTDPGNYGFSFRQGGGTVNAATITGVTVTAPTQVTIAMSAAPTGNVKLLDIGMTGTLNAPPGPLTGPRCCLRDSATDAVRTPGAPFALLRNYALHQTITVS